MAELNMFQFCHKFTQMQSASAGSSGFLHPASFIQSLSLFDERSSSVAVFIRGSLLSGLTGWQPVATRIIRGPLYPWPSSSVALFIRAPFYPWTSSSVALESETSATAS
jgi:hypothetical protein